jgi:hypothetical protein
MLHDEFLYDKAWIPIRAYMLFRLGKLQLICYMFCIEFCQALLTLMRDLSCSKNQDHVHSTQICTTLTLGVGGKTCLSFRSTQKYFTPTLSMNTKNMLDRFSIHQMHSPKVLVAISQKFCCREETWVMQKLFIKKSEKIDTKVSKILKTMGT